MRINVLGLAWPRAAPNTAMSAVPELGPLTPCCPNTAPPRTRGK